MDLTDAIAIGYDSGHTPFEHEEEAIILTV
jgi:hypothetical protein